MFLKYAITFFKLPLPRQHIYAILVYIGFGGHKVENKFQPYIENAVFLAAYAATEKHGTYDHSFSWSFCAL